LYSVGVAFSWKQHRRVDLLGEDAAVLDSFDVLASSTISRAATSGSAQEQGLDEFHGISSLLRAGNSADVPLDRADSQSPMLPRFSLN